MSKKTKLIVYVDKDIMDKPASLFNAVFDHMVKKGLDMAVRKRFMSAFMRAVRVGSRIDVIHEWVQVRDVATFPFRKEDNEDKGTERGVSVDDGADGKPE